MGQNPLRWKCENCGQLVTELSYCSSCWEMVCQDCYDPYVGVCICCVNEIFHAEICRRPIFFRKSVKETQLRKRKEAGPSLYESNAKCCENSFLKHEKVRGEIFCMNCGTVIVERTYGQGGRRGGMWLGKHLGYFLPP